MHRSSSPVQAAGPPGCPPPYAVAGGADLAIPEVLRQGTEMLKVSAKKKKRVVFRLDPEEGQILFKSNKSGVVPIEAIKEIRAGANTSSYRIQFSVPEEWQSRWLTIIYVVDGTYKTLHMVADTRDTFKLWEVAVMKLHAIRQGLATDLGNLDLRQTVWERQYWKGADKEGDHKLDFKDVKALTKRLNISLTSSQLKQMFQSADSKKQGYLDFEDYQVFVKKLKFRPELNTVYESIIAGTGKLDYSVFKKFMSETQKSSLPDNEMKSIFVKFAHAQEFSENTSLSLDQFSSFLLSPDNAILSEHGKTTWQDMTQPLPNYYISSSHNTYLVGHQLVGVSTVEGYIRALLHSCRSVELDIYDGDDEPVIYHGKTFTSKVPLRDICRGIHQYAFAVSPYPIIISAEIHCGLHGQEQIVEVMTEIFGDSLVQVPIESRQALEQLPSPEQLKHKILFKAKNQYIVQEMAEQMSKLKAQREQEQAHHREERINSLLNFTSSSESSSSDTKDETSGGFRQGLKMKWRKFRGKSRSSSPNTLATSDAHADSHALTPSTSKDAAHPKMSFRLLSLLVYTVGVKCHGIGPDTPVTYAPEHIFSLSENAANRLMKSGDVLKNLIRHTQKSLVRTYPKGMRINSSNYEPHRYWAAGAQVAAINWQTFDLGYMINQAMFQRNGRCGYVLKPLALRAEGEELLSIHTHHFFDVTIISAQQLPLPRDSSGKEIIEDSVVDPYVEVTLHIPDWSAAPFTPSSPSYEYKPATDAARKSSISNAASSARQVSLCTKVIKNNGFNPVWQEKLSIPFDCVGGPDGGMNNLIFVEIAVRQSGSDDDEEPIAVFCSPLGTFQSGYRHLPLCDMQLAQHMFSTLFIHTTVRDVV
ncbi:hypothetical protein AGABI1DRAFT_72480 [Agaricus bisporus var. burnettii JB137-S8]|uniref:Phosphoinositide phospholipase C n=1 Tax=Agaricus bisporus var. burnettii (strain JB137-S8 / ATCC MYA-4627 / FGSC 10392) TaxID=597362 RepID=K5XX24_AGABU|nr:uncharacterized protein AGABI1DRAFT_72480 [Agaricus bisporus var. burnettii JB137-S8]EKM79830.1 hypothetical protein AGABI1DRAFT_72480 [Agaricus bisporus var. burnettii JB137-S8]